MRIIRARLPSNFTKVPNAALRDVRLSWKARGLHAYLLSHVDEGWPSAATYLAEQGPDGRDSCEAGLRELAKHGYIVRTRRQTDGGRWTTDITVFEVPPPNPDFPGSANQQETASQADNGKSVPGQTEPGKPGSGPTSEDTQSPRSDRTRVDRDPENPCVKEKTTEETKKISQSAHRRQAVRQLMATYRLNEQEAVIAARIAEQRCPKAGGPDNLAAYIAGMKDGDMADIAAAVTEQATVDETSKKTGGSDDDHTYEASAVQPDQPSYQPPPYVPPVEAKPVSEIPSADPLAGLTNEELRDWMHVNLGCKTLNCERCWRVRESGQHPMFPATNMDTIPPMQESA